MKGEKSRDGQLQISLDLLSSKHLGEAVQEATNYYGSVLPSRKPHWLGAERKDCTDVWPVQRSSRELLTRRRRGQ